MFLTSLLRLPTRILEVQTREEASTEDSNFSYENQDSVPKIPGVEPCPTTVMKLIRRRYPNPSLVVNLWHTTYSIINTIHFCQLTLKWAVILLESSSCQPRSHT
jgi:hypothetical protein